MITDTEKVRIRPRPGERGLFIGKFLFISVKVYMVNLIMGPGDVDLDRDWTDDNGHVSFEQLNIE